MREVIDEKIILDALNDLKETVDEDSTLTNRLLEQINIRARLDGLLLDAEKTLVLTNILSNVYKSATKKAIDMSIEIVNNHDLLVKLRADDEKNDT